MFNVNYDVLDFEKTIRTDIQLRQHAGGDLKFKVFKIFFNRKKKNKNMDAGKNGNGLGGAGNTNQFRNNNGSNGSDDNGSIADSQVNQKGAKMDDDTLMRKHGFSAMQALNDESIF